MANSAGWLAIFPALFGGLLISFFLAGLVRPRKNAISLRPLASYGVHASLWLMLFGFALLLWQRPYFTAFNVLALHLLIVLINNAKYHALREPFIFQDFEYFWDAVRHPRLYLPFFGIRLTILAVSGYVLVVIAGLLLEAALHEAVLESWWDVAVHGVLIAAAGTGLAFWSARFLPQATFDLNADLLTMGLPAMLWSYAVEERKAIGSLKEKAPFLHPPRKHVLSSDLPNLVVVQSESFFDARRIFPQLRPQILGRFDQLRQEAQAYGRLKVSAWGANTVRTEFGFLSGLAAERIGIHRFNPYRKLASSGIATLATFLRAQGYRTVCIHPYAKTFYNRDRIMPVLGFDAFLDMHDFPGATFAGPYISDDSVADKIIDLLAVERNQPLFIHAITMENHGPLHWEHVGDSDRQAVLQEALPPGCDDLVAYARHLANADRMFGRLADALSRSERPSGMCIFGDHVPIMSTVYAALGEPDGTTDYVLWSAGEEGASVSCDIGVDCLATMFLRSMRIID